MGGTDFSVIKKGKTAQAAFVAAVEEARYNRGHSGYTGTIAEKRSFVEVAVPVSKDPYSFASELSESDVRYEDKWGPALCVRLSEDTYMFFGVASC